MSPVVSPLDFVFAFLGGILISFSPCVYPLIPIVIGSIGVLGQGSKLKGFVLSLIYALGVAVTYSALGLIASLTGKLFGQIATHPITHFFIANVCIFFGLVLLGVFKIPILPAFSAKVEKKGIASIFLLGLVSGLVISPCTTPVLGSILIFVGSKQNIIYGTLLLFCFAYGVSTVLILAGTFSSVLINLPKPGAWMKKINMASGIILILMGEYFLVQTGRHLL